MFKITPNKGAWFYARQEYIKSVDLYSIVPEYELSQSQEEEFIESGFICLAELKAISYLARCEQCRFSLTNKLIQKQFKKNHIQKALDFLENKNYLSDKRFATAWLNTRKLNHYEGKTRLLCELLSRGICKETAQECLKEFFTENDEQEICQKAYEKLIKKGKQGEKLISAMLQAGFSYKMIKTIEW